MQPHTDADPGSVVGGVDFSKLAAKSWESETRNEQPQFDGLNRPAPRA